MEHQLRHLPVLTSRRHIAVAARQIGKLDTSLRVHHRQLCASRNQRCRLQQRRRLRARRSRDQQFRQKHTVSRKSGIIAFSLRGCDRQNESLLLLLRREGGGATASGWKTGSAPGASCDPRWLPSQLDAVAAITPSVWPSPDDGAPPAGPPPTARSVADFALRMSGPPRPFERPATLFARHAARASSNHGRLSSSIPAAPSNETRMSMAPSPPYAALARRCRHASGTEARS